MKAASNGAVVVEAVGRAKPTCIEEMRAILADIEVEHLTHEEQAKKRLQWEDWNSLLSELVSYAGWQIGIRWWRGELGEGVLPEGYDANALASEAIATALRGESRLVFGWTRERLVRELKRLVSREVRRLQSLIEASRMRSEWDILPPDEEDQLQSVFEEMEGTIADGSEELMEKEEEARRERIKTGFATHLNGDKGARRVFNCLCDGILKRRDIAAKLGINVRAVTAARKRLERQVEQFRKGCRGRRGRTQSAPRQISF